MSTMTYDLLHVRVIWVSWTCNFASQSLGLGYRSLGLGLSQSHGLDLGRQSLARGLD